MADDEVFVLLEAGGGTTKFFVDADSDLNKQLLKAYRNRKVIDHPIKWEVWGSFRCIDEHGKKIDGALFGPRLGKIKVESEYSEIEFDDIARTLGKQADAVKDLLKKRKEPARQID